MTTKISKVSDENRCKIFAYYRESSLQGQQSKDVHVSKFTPKATEADLILVCFMLTFAEEQWLLITIRVER
jgi:hypothetical protein